MITSNGEKTSFSVSSIKEYMSKEDDGVKGSSWNIVDDTYKFGNPTGEVTLIGLGTDGIFSNSATTGSNLTVGIFPTENTFDIIMMEYGKYTVSTYKFTLMAEGFTHAYKTVFCE